MATDPMLDVLDSPRRSARLLTSPIDAAPAAVLNSSLLVDNPGDITLLLRKWGAGDRSVLDPLFELAYPQLITYRGRAAERQPLFRRASTHEFGQ
jgi:hypothetical protein